MPEEKARNPHRGKVAAAQERQNGGEGGQKDQGSMPSSGNRPRLT
jgi:hypothetical protein